MLAKTQPRFADILNDPVKAVPFLEALRVVATERGHLVAQGIRAYQNHTAQRLPALDQRPAVWQRGTTRLLDYGGATPGLAPVLVVPSLINRFDIMDLDADSSFIRSLAADGFHPLVIDWGTVGDEERNFSLGDYVTQRILPIMDFLRGIAPNLHVMGYCLGGLLALAGACLRPEGTRSLTLFATPWHTGASTLEQRDTPAFLVGGDMFVELLGQIEPHLKQAGVMPVSMLQFLFAALQPGAALKKFARFARQDQTTLDARRFVLTEDWLNDGVPLAAPAARELIGEIYGNNATGKIKWQVGGQTIDPRLFTKPTAVIVPNQDRIVPPAAALPLARLIRGATLFQPNLGHVGLMVGRRARADVWGPLSLWLHKVA